MLGVFAMQKRIWIVTFAIVLLYSSPAFADKLKLHYGTNRIDLNSDGLDDLILKVRWENGNAHSFDKYLVALNNRKNYLEIPLGDRANYNFTSSEGADCILEDYTFRKDETGRLEVLRFRREHGKSYGDFQKVTITTYKLIEDPDPIPGFPPYFLKPMTKRITEKKYCDVRELMH